MRLRIELGVPIEVIEPAIVQVVWREQPAVAVKLMHRRCKRMLLRKHPRLLRREIALAQVTWRARRHHVFPGGLATFAARNDVIEGEIVGRQAILAGEAIAQEDVEAGEGRMRGRLDERLQLHDAG